MMDHTDNTLRAAIKALTEVVAPAIDSRDPQATEQLRLVIDALQFLRDRLDYLHDRNRFEVSHYVDLAQAIVDDAATAVPTHARELRDAIQAGAAVLERADARDPDLRAASAALARAVRLIVRELPTVDEDTRRRIEWRILTATKRQLIADRAWHYPQGFDPDPAADLPLEAVLSPSA